MDKKDLTYSTLVPIDFSVNSLVALEHAAAIAHISEDNKNKVVTLLHVIEGANFRPVYDIAGVENNDRDALAIEGAINRLQSIIQKYKDQFDVNFAYVVVGGKPPRMIADVAGEIEAQSIVMGTHGSSGIQAIAGSNASRVIALAPCPVITIREKALGQGYKNIVLPLDLSSETKQKVHIASVVAKYFNATVHIVTVDPKDEFLAHRVNNNLHQVEAYFSDRDINYTTTKLQEGNGSFGRQTLVWAEGKGADLIVIMSETERGVSDFIFGSYAQQIVNRASIPVMTVNPHNNMAGFDIISFTS